MDARELTYDVCELLIWRDRCLHCLHEPASVGIQPRVKTTSICQVPRLILVDEVQIQVLRQALVC